MCKENELIIRQVGKKDLPGLQKHLFMPVGADTGDKTSHCRGLISWRKAVRDDSYLNGREPGARRMTSCDIWPALASQHRPLETDITALISAKNTEIGIHKIWPSGTFHVS